MLRMIPRAPSKVSVKDLCDQLRDADFVVTERTVQRDLVELSSVFPLAVDDRAKPFGWSWQRDASSLTSRSLDSGSADAHAGGTAPAQPVTA